jgi:hypothetical protein
VMGEILTDGGIRYHILGEVDLYRSLHNTLDTPSEVSSEASSIANIAKPTRLRIAEHSSPVPSKSPLSPA